MARKDSRRRQVVPAIAILLSGVVLLSAACSSTNKTSSTQSSVSKPVSITLGGSSTPQDPISLAGNTFSREATKLSKGTITVKLRPDNQLGTSQQLASSVESGAVQMATLSPPDMAQVNTEVSAMGLPFLFSNWNQAKTFFASKGRVAALNNDLLRTGNYHVLGWMAEGFVDVLAKSPIHTLGDFKGVRLRVQPDQIQPTLYGSIGSQTTSLDFSEVFTALQTGTIQGFGDPPQVLYNGKFYQVAKNLVICNDLFNVTALVINAGFYNKLSPAQQAAVTKAGEIAATDEMNSVEAINSQDLAKMQAAGVTITHLSAQDLSQWKQKASSLYRTFDGQHPGVLKKLGFNL